MKKPLEGIRVLECAIFHAGPGASAILGDLGAEVIKIEEPEVGDPIRNIKRIGRIPFEIKGGRSIFCEGANRNKKSLTLDIQSKKGYAILGRLIKSSDVFLTNFRKPTIENLKITYPILEKINPRLIYASVSAYGSKGPESHLGGFDYQGQARSGLMYSMGEEGMIPLLSQFGLIDQATAVMAANHIMTALFVREREGIGQEVHVSILGTSTYMLYFNMLVSIMGGFNVPRHQRPKENPLRNYYKCSDEGWLLMTLTPPEKYWENLCRVLEVTELINDPRFDTDLNRSDNAEQLVAIFDKIFLKQTRNQWLKIFYENGLVAGPVNTINEAVDDLQVKANDYIVDFDHPELGKIKIPGFPAQFSKSQVKTYSPAPKIGEHTDEILTEIGGYTKVEIALMRKEKLI